MRALAAAKRITISDEKDRCPGGGGGFFGVQNPRLLTRSICLYIDPQAVLADPDLRFAEAGLLAISSGSEVSFSSLIARGSCRQP